jgi:hypothetical protein
VLGRKSAYTFLRRTGNSFHESSDSYQIVQILRRKGFEKRLSYEAIEPFQNPASVLLDSVNHLILAGLLPGSV